MHLHLFTLFCLITFNVQLHEAIASIVHEEPLKTDEDHVIVGYLHLERRADAIHVLAWLNIS